MKASVVVCTYNAPRELDLVLCGLVRQTRAPDEILVADDGSTPETAQLLASWRSRLDIRHVWHKDDGFRKMRIINEAVRRSTGDHLIFLDGDSIPHRSWVADHVQAANGKRVLCGRRVKLGDDISRCIDAEWVTQGRLESLLGPVWRSSFGGGTSRVMLGVRLPQALARCFHPRARKLMGVNFSLPRAAFEAVNGYEEAPGIRGREDQELEWRLRRAGVPFYPLLNRAIVYHLFHPQRPIDATTRAWLAEREQATHTRAEVGLDSEFDPAR